MYFRRTNAEGWQTPFNCKKLPIVCAGYHTYTLSAHTDTHLITEQAFEMCLPRAEHCCSGHKVVGNSSFSKKKKKRKFSFCISRIAGTFGRSGLNHTWLMVFSICTKPRLGSMLFIKSTIVSRFSCCRIKGLWLPNRLKATLNMTSDPWRKIISGKTQKSRKLSRTRFWWNGTPFPFTHIEEQDCGKCNPKL